MEPPIQALGSFNTKTNEYSFSLCSGSLVITFDFLKKTDIEHLISCLSCMLGDEEPSEQ